MGRARYCTYHLSRDCVPAAGCCGGRALILYSPPPRRSSFFPSISRADRLRSRVSGAWQMFRSARRRPRVRLGHMPVAHRPYVPGRRVLETRTWNPGISFVSSSPVPTERPSCRRLPTPAGLRPVSHRNRLRATFGRT